MRTRSSRTPSRRTPARPPAVRAALALALGLLACTASGAERAAPVPAGPGELQDRIVSLANQLTPSVVHIEAIVKHNDRRNQVTGSGVIASPDGRILTNHHVVDRAEKISVLVPGVKGKIPARLVGSDQQTDVALLRIETAAPLQAARFGTADDVRVGQWVLAVGNPYGLDGTVSLGIVSAKGRNLGIPNLLNDFIQTDAMIDRGSSGGPLVDLSGNVVGINSRGQGRGIGFTIPIDTALRVMEQLEAGGVARGWLGITMQPLDRELADYFGMPDATGVVVTSVSGGSPAERAGLRPGDVITRFDGRAVEAEKDEDLGVFQRQVANVEPGRTAVVELLREGRPEQLAVKLAEAPRVDPDEAETDVGFHVQEITEILYRAQRLNSRAGAYVSFVARGTPAAEAGLNKGDVIRLVETTPVDDLADFRAAMRSVSGRDRFLLTAERGEETVFLLVHRGAEPVEDGEGAADQAAGEARHTEDPPAPSPPGDPPQAPPGSAPDSGPEPPPGR